MVSRRRTRLFSIWRVSYLIVQLLHPFGERAHISLNPGKGRKRPSYAIEISDFGINITSMLEHQQWTRWMTWMPQRRRS